MLHLKCFVTETTSDVVNQTKRKESPLSYIHFGQK